VPSGTRDEWSAKQGGDLRGRKTQSRKKGLAMPVYADRGAHWAPLLARVRLYAATYLTDESVELAE